MIIYCDASPMILCNGETIYLPAAANLAGDTVLL